MFFFKWHHGKRSQISISIMLKPQNNPQLNFINWTQLNKINQMRWIILIISPYIIYLNFFRFKKACKLPLVFSKLKPIGLSLADYSGEPICRFWISFLFKKIQSILHWGYCLPFLLTIWRHDDWSKCLYTKLRSVFGQKVINQENPRDMRENFALIKLEKVWNMDRWQIRRFS